MEKGRKDRLLDERKEGIQVLFYKSTEGLQAAYLLTKF